MLDVLNVVDHMLLDFSHLPMPNVTCGRCHKYGHATKDRRIQLGTLNISGAEGLQCDSLIIGICFIL